MIKRRTPDKAKAKGMVFAAEIDMAFISGLPVTTKAAQSIIRGIYENFRILGDALLTAQGFKAEGIDHHTQMIDALVKLGIKTTRPLLLLDELKKMRHQINYNGYVPTENDVKYVIELKESFWADILCEVKKQIES
ncbi:hypothetical protein HYY73_06085 [Candidatus Woesearchaeota archaeon]|nr:hypothetical protein [Candidatus Woesearchaeota archaeon]